MKKLFHNYNFNGEKIIPANNKFWSKPKVTKHRIRNTIYRFSIFALMSTFLFNGAYDNIESNGISTYEYQSEIETERLVEPINIIEPINYIDSKCEVINESEYEKVLYHAINYSDILHLSKAKIYDKLATESDNQFSINSINYVLDNINVDWKENALNNAKDYINKNNENGTLSKEFIYYLLISEYGGKFTEEEAQYAIDNIEMIIN